MPIVLPELEYIRSKDARLADALQKILDEVNLTQKGTGVAPAGRLPAPPTLGGISVTAAGGTFDVQLTDKAATLPGVTYFVEYDTSPQFSNAYVVPLGVARNRHITLGNGTYYWRAYSQNVGGVQSPIVVFGGTTPTGVAGGGAVVGPAPQTTQGSGTSQAPGFGFGTPPNVTAGRKAALQ